jgi:hypothetical protein
VNWLVNEVTSAPSATPVVVGADRISTDHSENVEFALPLEHRLKSGVCSGARMESSVERSSRLETADPVPVFAAGAVGWYVLEIAIMVLMNVNLSVQLLQQSSLILSEIFETSDPIDQRLFLQT